MSNQTNGLASLFRNPLSGLDASWRRALLNPAVSVLIALLVAQLVAALVLASNAMQSATIADTPLLDLSGKQVTRIEISTDDEQVVLARANDTWVLPALADFPADADRVEQLLGTLTALKRPLPVGSSSEAQRRLKVADDNAERRISLSDETGKLAQLLIGDSPGFRRLYGRLADKEAVYDLPLANFQVAANSDDWVKQDQLRVDAEAIERISIDDWMLSRADGSWQLETEANPSEDGSISTSEVDALVSRIANLSYQGVRMPPAEADRMADTRRTEASAPRADASRGAAADVDAGAGAEAAISDDSPDPVTTKAEPTAAALQSEPVLQLRIVLKDGSSLSRTVFAAGNGSYLLQTDTDPQLYELSEYDLDGLLELEPEQLLVSSADAPTAEPGITETDPEDAIDPAAEAGAVPAMGTKEAEQPTPVDETPVSEAPSESAAEAPADAADATIEPAEEQPAFRPQQVPAQPPAQRPAPPQWPYQRYAPPSRQPWPPQGPSQGAPPQTAPGWR